MKELENILDILIFNLDLKLTSEQRKQLLEALKKTYNKGITDSAESVRTDRGRTYNDCGECGYTEIDKQSILKLIIP